MAAAFGQLLMLLVGDQRTVYVQSERNAAGLYLKYAKQLVEQGDAYYCFCDAERLSQCKRNVGGKEISIYDKHCLGLSKEEVEANLAAAVFVRSLVVYQAGLF